ncbi:NAD(P)H azoreductase [Baekduia alba]|uniref:NAD(P)H-binding protein n=1 Tax=Baekduia alba TaxID=2997333 RepID=UPI0023420D38|nr:NAD(P)H-binding protein [Baekduia alba]WCB95302.1 NAD(P)H azoreductase [Baekduia alba]
MILVTGATGTVGRELVTLLAQGGERVVAVARHPEAAALPDGVVPVAADLADPAALAPHLDGVRAIFLNPAAVEGGAEQLLALAAAHGVQHAVLLSAMTVAFPAGEPRFADRFRVLEDLVRASGLSWTLLRAGDFAGNVRLWAPQIRNGGVVRAAYPGAATAPLVERDLSAVAARVLVDPGHEGKAYVLTGPRALDQREKLAAIAETIGRSLELVELTPAQAKAGMVANGVPSEIADRLLGSLADYAAQPGPTTDDVAQLLGRPALPFADWAAANARLFAD